MLAGLLRHFLSDNLRPRPTPEDTRKENSARKDRILPSVTPPGVLRLPPRPIGHAGGEGPGHPPQRAFDAAARRRQPAAVVRVRHSIDPRAGPNVDQPDLEADPDRPRVELDDPKPPQAVGSCLALRRGGPCALIRQPVSGT